MAVRSVIDVDVDDEKFKKFLELYKQFQGQVKELPAEWQAGAAAISGATDELDALTAAYAARTEQARAFREEDKRELAEREKARVAAQERAKQERDAERERVSLERAARKEKAEADKETASLARERLKLEEDHEKQLNVFWTNRRQQAHGFVKDLAFGLAGIGVGLFGLEALAGSVNHQRLAAQGLGITTGEKQAFDVNFGNRLGLDSSFIGGVQDAQADLTQRWKFGGLGLAREAETEDHAALSADVIKRAKELWDEAGPQGRTVQQMQARGLDAFMSFSQWQTIGAQTPQDVDRYAQQYVKDSKSLAVDDPDQRAWQDLTTQLHRAGLQIENVLVRGLAPLAGPLSDLSQSVAESIRIFLANPKLKEWITDLGQGIQSVARYMASDKFQKDVVDASNALVELAKDVGAVVAWFKPMMSKLGLVPGAKDDYSLNPLSPGTAAVPNSPTATVPWYLDTPSHVFRRLFGGKGIDGMGRDANGRAPGETGYDSSTNPLDPQTHGAAPGGGSRVSDDDIYAVEDKFGIPHGLLEAIGHTESGNTAHPKDTFDGNPGQWHRGQFQMSDDMLKRLGVTDAYDPKQVLPAAAREFKGYLDHFGGNVPAAIAAWNQGQGGADRAIAAAKNAGETDLNDFYRHESPQVQGYVAKTLSHHTSHVQVHISNQTGAQVAVTANAVQQ